MLAEENPNYLTNAAHAACRTQYRASVDNQGKRLHPRQHDATVQKGWACHSATLVHQFNSTGEGME